MYQPLSYVVTALNVLKRKERLSIMVRKDYRSSLETHNAPYRGSTRREDAVNFDLAVIHDLMHIERVSGANEKYKGHKQHINENLTSLYYSEGEITSSIPTAGFLTKREETITPNIPDWTKQFQATLTSSTSKWKTYTLSGSTHLAGAETVLMLNPGDIVVLRVQVNALIDNNLKFAIGSPWNNGAPDYLIHKTSDFYNKPHYIEKRIVSETQQEVRIGIYAVYGSEGNNKLELTNISIARMYQEVSNVEGMDTSTKQKINNIEHQVKNLEKRKDTLKEVFG